MGSNSNFVFVFSEFSDFYNFSFSVLPRTFLSNEPSETLDSSTTVNFLVSVHISTFFLSLVCFSVFVVGGILLGSEKVFGLRFPRFCHWWDVKPLRGFLSSFEGFVSTF